MTYPLFAGQPTETDESQVIGGDILFLLDTDSGFFVADIKQIAKIVEADCYYDEPSRMDGAKVYVLYREEAPTEVVVRYYIERITDEVVYKTVRIAPEVNGILLDLIAQAPYEIYKK